MAAATLKRPAKRHITKPENLGQLLDRLGNVPLDRIRFEPALGSATEEDVLRLLETPDKRICELIEGVLVEKPMGFKESSIAAIVIQKIGNYLDENDLGIAFSPDAPMRVRPGRVRFPDAGFISWKRLPNEEFPQDKVLKVMPELAVEVLSESNTEQEMALKLDDYFQSGVKLVWYIDPEDETVTVYTGRNTKKTLTQAQSLDGGKVLPGFMLPIKKLFARVHHKKKKS